MPSAGRGVALLVKTFLKDERVSITCTINGKEYKGSAPPRMLLVHYVRDELNLTGTNIGCDTGHCGACTIIFNGNSTKSCMMLAVQAQGPRS
jgi:carbon-monoxide dehydrogenase small subunit